MTPPSIIRHSVLVALRFRPMPAIPSVALAFALLLPGPAAVKAAAAGTSSRDLPFQILFSGSLYLGGSTPLATRTTCANPCYFTISTQRALSQFWASHGLGFRGPAPRVDFAHHMVVVAGRGEEGVSMLGIGVSRVLLVGKTLQVYVHLTAGDGGTLFGFYHPTALIEVPGRYSQVEYVAQDDLGGCYWELIGVCRDVTVNGVASIGPPDPPCRQPPPVGDATEVACYPPAAVTRAEALLRPRPVNPSSAVARLTHLHLRQVIDARWGSDSQHHWGPHFIDYLYGPSPQLDQHDFSREHPTFVHVVEGQGVLPPDRQPDRPVLWQRLEEFGRAGAGVPPSQGRQGMGPWELRARIPHHSNWVIVIADGSQASVYRLGLQILHSLG